MSIAVCPQYAKPNAEAWLGLLEDRKQNASSE